MVEIVDFGTYRRNTAIRTLESRPKQWTSGLYNYQITALSVSDKAVMVDLRVSRGRVILLDDRIWVSNPPTMTGDGIFKTYSKYINPDQPENPQWFTDEDFAKLAQVDQKAYVPTGDRGPRDTMVFDPWGAMQKTLEQVFSIVTKDGPRIERIGRSDRFSGDTLAVRSGTADGYVQDADTTWASTQNGPGEATTTTGNIFLRAWQISGTSWQLHQGFLGFDTSPLGASATVTAYVLTLYADAAGVNDVDGVTQEWYLYDWGGTLENADFRDCSPSTNITNLTKLANQALSSWTDTAGAANDLTRNGAFSSINKVGTTYMMGLLNRAYDGTPSGANSVAFRSADEAGTTSDPLLTVTYTVGTARVSNLTQLGVS